MIKKMGEKEEVFVICQKCNFRSKAGDVYSRPNNCPTCGYKFRYERLKQRTITCDACYWEAKVLVEDEDKLPDIGRCPNDHFVHFEHYEPYGESDDGNSEDEGGLGFGDLDDDDDESGTSIQEPNKKRKTLRQQRQSKDGTSMPAGQKRLS